MLCREGVVKMARTNLRSSGKGRGWHGDSEGHREAGRKGGRSRGRKAAK